MKTPVAAARFPSILSLMLKPLILAAILLAGQASAAPSDEMFQKLHDAPSESEANDAAQDIWAAWMESGSPTVDMIMERAVDAQTVGEFDTARALYDRAVMLEPDYAEAWSRRASLFLNDENFPEALRDLNEALRLEPRHFGAWAGLGIMMETMGAEKEALEAYRQALDIYPFMTQALQAEKRLAKQAEGQGL
ncbi:MAG: tetratricopeptide repeat protein [Hyphomonas sp.]|uniref:tetratricopeptide repeat protein n=1 Tax=Hyphomonas sp. TaxID=87 RepID=UPI0030010A2A